MNIAVLMGGESPAEGADAYPVYMAEIGGRLVLQTQIDYCRELSPQNMVFCTKSADIKNYHVDAILRQCADNAICVEVRGQTAGSVCTALLAADYFDNDSELILMAVNDFIEEDGLRIVSRFRERGLDAGCVSFTSVHPRYSFALLDEESDYVLEVAEKRPISKAALASFYYFRRGADFVRAAKSVIRKDRRINGAFYISQTLNELILEQKKVGLYPIANSQYHPLKSEMQLAQYILDLKNREESK